MSELKSTSAEVVIIGGGPAGLSCARALKKAGLRDVIILEREAGTAWVRELPEVAAA